MKLLFFLVGDQPPSQTPLWGPHAIFGAGLHDEPEEHLCKRLVGERLIFNFILNIPDGHMNTSC